MLWQKYYDHMNALKAAKMQSIETAGNVVCNITATKRIQRVRVSMVSAIPIPIPIPDPNTCPALTKAQNMVW